LNDMTPASIGHNRPPDPIDEALAPYGDYITEAEAWLDGTPVETEDQMKAVDAIIKQIRSAKVAVDKAKKAATAPLYDVWKAEGERWKPTEDDIARRLKGLVGVVDGFKLKLAEAKDEAKRKAYAEARAKEREAEEAARQADPTDYEAATRAADLKAAAMEAQKAATAANKDTVKGLRTVTRYEITDHRKALHWIAGNDRDAITAFIEAYVKANHKTKQIDGVRVWQEKEAF